MDKNSTLKYKLNADRNDPRYISDGMNEFERNIKRLIDLLTAFLSLSS